MPPLLFLSMKNTKEAFIMKKILASFIALLMIALLAVPALAVESNSYSSSSMMTPNYTYIWQMSAGLKISSAGKAHCSGNVVVSDDSFHAELTITLQKKSNGTWVNVKSWSDSETGKSDLIIEEDYYVANGTYRVTTTAKIYNPTGTKLLESESFSSQERTY